MLREFTVISVCLFLVTAPSAALDVGVGTADITPDVKTYSVPMSGYGARRGNPSTGVHDPLHAKVLYLRDRDTSMALITCDLRSITPEFKGQIVKKSASHGLTLDNVLISASHTHCGPSMYPEKFWQMQFGAYDPKIVDIMSTSVAKAIAQAVQNAAPARIGFAEGRAEGFTRNRRWGYDNKARKTAGEEPAVDPTVWVMRVDTMDGGLRALLVNFATHPTILGHENMLISAEWPGALQRELEKLFPGATALYTNGAQGDQAPSGARGADGFEKVNDFGTRLAKIAGEIARRIETKAAAPIGFGRGTPALPAFVFTENSKKQYGSYLNSALDALPRTAELQVFQIGTTALVSLPGEPILEVGQAVQRSVGAHGFDKVVVIGLANDYIGYLVNEKEYAHGGYEVDSRSYYGPGLGTFIAEQAGKVAQGLRSEQADEL